MTVSTWRRFAIPAALAVAGWLSVVATIDPAGDYPWLGEGPGVTVDESINVQIGVLMVDRLLDGDFAGYQQILVDMHDYPPLGRLWLGVWHEFAYLIAPPQRSRDVYVVACARIGSAVAFGLLLAAMWWYTSKWHGRAAGFAAAAAVFVTPRLFGHAHIASLETCMNLAYLLAVFVMADRWGNEDRGWKMEDGASNGTALPSALLHPPSSAAPGWLAAVLAGIVFGLALLTKIQAILLPVPVAIWAVWNWRRRAVLPLVIWGTVALVVMLIGWSWLWSHPVGRMRIYLSQTTQRISLPVWYLGQSVRDREVAWHYPWVMFATTVPFGLLVLGAWGVLSGRRSQKSEVRNQRSDRPDAPHDPRSTIHDLPSSILHPRSTLLLACLVFPLVVFSIPRVAVYDGERLFLVSYPLWCVFAGVGASKLFDVLSSRWNAAKAGCRRAGLVTAIVIVAQGCGLATTAPCWLSHYNVLVGGLRGAEQIGLSTTYWADSFTRSFLREVAAAVPEGSTVDVVPVMTPTQLPWLERQSPLLRDRQIRLRAFRDDNEPPPKYFMVYLRKDAIEPWQRDTPPGAKVLAELRRSGVRLAALFELPDAPEAGAKPN